MSKLGPSRSLTNTSVSLDAISDNIANTMSGMGFMIPIITLPIFKRLLAGSLVRHWNLFIPLLVTPDNRFARVGIDNNSSKRTPVVIECVI
ncbi:hypothetical protein BH11PAT2_BH11PAT2_01420 [soil metagenome]